MPATTPQTLDFPQDRWLIADARGVLRRAGWLLMAAGAVGEALLMLRAWDELVGHLPAGGIGRLLFDLAGVIASPFVRFDIVDRAGHGLEYSVLVGMEACLIVGCCGAGLVLVSEVAARRLAFSWSLNVSRLAEQLALLDLRGRYALSRLSAVVAPKQVPVAPPQPLPVAPRRTRRPRTTSAA